MRSLLTIRDVSLITGLSVQTLYNLRSQGTGPKSFSLRGRVRYEESDLEEWIARQRDLGGYS